MNAAKNDEKWVETPIQAYPLELADDGFSVEVLSQLKRREKLRILVLAPFFFAAFAVFMIFFPYEIFGGLVAATSGDFQTFMPFLVPFGAVLGMFLFSWFSEEVT